MEFETILKSDLSKPVQVKQLTGNLFSGDNKGNKITVEVLDNGSPATLTGDVSGYVIRADGKTVVIADTQGTHYTEKDGNRVSVILPQSAYVVVGQVSIVIKVGTVTVGACTSYVYKTTTDKQIDPGSVVPDISTLMGIIEDCVGATEAAESATLAAQSITAQAGAKITEINSAILATSSAIARADTATNAANSVATYIGGLTVVASTLSPDDPATATLSTESGHAKITFGIPKGDPGEVTQAEFNGLKSAFIGRILASPTWERGRYDNTGEKASNNNYIRTVDKIAYSDSMVLIISNHRPINVRARVFFYSNSALLGSTEFMKRSFMLKDYAPTGTTYFTLSVTSINSTPGLQSTDYGDTMLITDWHNTTLPVDYELQTELNNTIKTERERIDYINEYGFGGICPITFESGNISGGTEEADTTRARTDDYISYGKNNVIVSSYSDDTYTLHANIIFYDGNKDYITQSKWIKFTSIKTAALKNYEGIGASYYRVVVQLYSTSRKTLNATDMAEIAKGVKIYNVTDCIASAGTNTVNNEEYVTRDDLTKYETSEGLFETNFSYKLPFAGRFDNQIFTCTAKYTRDEGVTATPYIYFRYWSSGINGSAVFEIGQEGSYKTKQWRVGRPYKDNGDLTINFSIPSGVHLDILEFNNAYDNHIDRKANAIRFDGHRKFPGMPEDTMPSVEMCAKVGFGSMIQIPKRLSDGVWVFYHDDSLKYNDTYIRQADGTQLPSTYNGTLWSAISSETAFSWDWSAGFHNGEYAGQKPMTMQEFFMACAKTGMKPMFSIHPALTDSEFGEIKTLAKKYGVLNKLGIVGSASYIAQAYSILGNDIDTYMLVLSSGTHTEADVTSAIATMNGLTGCTTRRGIELFESTAYDAYFGQTTYNAFEMITNAGFIASLCQQNGATKPASGSSSVYAYGTDIEYWISQHGVTEFCYEQGYNSGLIW